MSEPAQIFKISDYERGESRVSGHERGAPEKAEGRKRKRKWHLNGWTLLIATTYLWSLSDFYGLESALYWCGLFSGIYIRGAIK